MAQGNGLPLATVLARGNLCLGPIPRRRLWLGEGLRRTLSSSPLAPHGRLYFFVLYLLVLSILGLPRARLCRPAGKTLQRSSSRACAPSGHPKRGKRHTSPDRMTRLEGLHVSAVTLCLAKGANNLVRFYQKGLPCFCGHSMLGKGLEKPCQDY